MNDCCGGGSCRLRTTGVDPQRAVATGNIRPGVAGGCRNINQSPFLVPFSSKEYLYHGSEE